MKNLGIYYGWLNSLNSASNGWDNEKVAQDLARYKILVFGNGLQSSSHGDYSNTKVILPRLKVLHPDCLRFGYISVNQSYASFIDKVREWMILGVEGIFFDEAGYDFGSVSTNSRSAFNEKVKYCKRHDLKCFINAWNPDHVLGVEEDASYPNSTWNPGLHDSALGTIDYLLLESFAITSSYTYESSTQWYSRGLKAVEMRDLYGIQLAGSSVINDGDSNEVNALKFIYISAYMFGLDCIGSSDASYGASSAKMKLVTRPDLIGLELCGDSPVKLATDKYCSYGVNGKLNIDFTSGSQTSSVTFY